MTLPDRPPCGLSDGSERFGQEVVERLTVRDAFLEGDGVRPELVVAQVLDLGLVGIHELREVGQVLQLSAFADVGDLVEDWHGGSFGLLRRRPMVPAEPWSNVRSALRVLPAAPRAAHSRG